MSKSKKALAYEQLKKESDVLKYRRNNLKQVIESGTDTAFDCGSYDKQIRDAALKWLEAEKKFTDMYDFYEDVFGVVIDL